MTRFLRFVIIFGVMILVVTTVTCVVLVARLSITNTQLIETVRDTQLEGTPVGKQILETSEVIQSCTTPGEPCYEDNLRRTSEVVGNIQSIVIASVTCADRLGTQDIDEITRCVTDFVRVPAKRN